MSLAGFVDDAHVGIVYAGHARIAVAAALVQQKPVLFGPGAALVEADVDGVVIAARLRVRVGEEQDRGIPVLRAEPPRTRKI